MGKLMIRNNEQSLIRNFTYLVEVHPDGYVSPPVKSDVWFVLRTREDGVRVLERIHNKPGPCQLRLSGDIGMGGVALGALGMWFALVATAFFL